MTLLTTAITGHNHETIERLISEVPSLVHETENGVLPIDWARKTGNIVTLLRFLRCSGEPSTREELMDINIKYLAMLAYDEYEPIGMHECAEIMWGVLYEWREYFIGRFKRKIVPTDNQEKDLRFLLSALHINSRESLVKVASNA